MLLAATATTMATLSTARAEGPRTADHASLGVFVGKWNVVGDMPPSALSPGGHFAGVHTGTWDFGGYWSAERTAGGARMLTRMVQHFAADRTLTWKIEASTDGTHWATAVTGRLWRRQCVRQLPRGSHIRLPGARMLKPRS
jgi:hypothetical protein